MPDPAGAADGAWYPLHNAFSAGVAGKRSVPAMSSALKLALNRQMNRLGGGDGPFATAVDGLYLMRATDATLPAPRIYRPALCIVAQGAKQVMLGESTFNYREGQALVIGLELPVLGRVVQASAEQPFLGLNLDLDVQVMRDVLAQLDPPPRPGPDASGVFVGHLGEALSDCVLRLLRLLDTPEAIPVIQPGIMREICYWLLTGPNAGEVCKIALPNGPTERIAGAIHQLREDITRAVRIDALAAAANMSPSTFHQHFKTLTSMTPLQYQKQLRLLEARRLMLAGEANASGAAYQVGYESASQFSREYARMFGTPPKRDVAVARLSPAI
ncbi:AraC family transcriptional regulator [Rhodanobacter sp. 115]|uniref:AraC family transcriptional regulator n=1 Tax=Rhodanobacter sp. FW021-MT20 TaxID=1162282 RepID=UPI00192B3AA6|nr:AraC family transcriptional regulator [Rhodanobacter sp. 115]